MGCQQSTDEKFRPPRCSSEGKLSRRRLQAKKIDIVDRKINTGDVGRLWTREQISNEEKTFVCCYWCGRLFDDDDQLLAHLLKGRRPVVYEQAATLQSQLEATEVARVLRMLLVVDLPFMTSFISVDKSNVQFAYTFSEFHQLSFVDPFHTILISDPIAARSIVRRATTLDNCPAQTDKVGSPDDRRLTLRSIARVLEVLTCPHCLVQFDSEEELAFHLVEQYASPDDAGRSVTRCEQEERQKKKMSLSLRLRDRFQKSVVERISALEFYTIQELPPITVSPKAWLNAEQQRLLIYGYAYLLVNAHDIHLDAYALQTWLHSTTRIRCPHCGECESNRANMVAHFNRYVPPRSALNRQSTAAAMLHSLKGSVKASVLAPTARWNMCRCTCCMTMVVCRRTETMNSIVPVNRL